MHRSKYHPSSARPRRDTRRHAIEADLADFTDTGDPYDGTPGIGTVYAVELAQLDAEVADLVAADHAAKHCPTRLMADAGVLTAASAATA